MYAVLFGYSQNEPVKIIFGFKSYEVSYIREFSFGLVAVLLFLTNCPRNRLACLVQFKSIFWGAAMTMKLLNTYEDKEEAEAAEKLITGKKRLASERDSTQVVYNLFGQASWGTFYKLGMFNLALLEQILKERKAGNGYDKQKHRETISILQYAAKQFELEIPEHWL
ncbi:hypothetical protein [Neptunomonas phycophila]|uniref:hypothetical protein n=1 Tax=Neptunomonas phycophila TaxID=1572645 RepID=UPI003518080A